MMQIPRQSSDGWISTVRSAGSTSSIIRKYVVSLIVLAGTVLYFYVDLLYPVANEESLDVTTTSATMSTTPNANATDDPFTVTPFCDANGTCHEAPDQPSPRTIYSARSKDQYERWWKTHARLNETAQLYAERRKNLPTDDPSRPLILLGDSITESWIGTDMGIKKDRTKGIPQVLQDLVESARSNTSLRFDPLVLAIGGDQTQHLLYRLQHGQLLPAFYANDPHAIFVVLIGTNNLGSGELPAPTARGVWAVADYILSKTSTQGGHVLLLAVLPRGDGSLRLPNLCPPRCSSNNEKPFSSFMPAIDKLNQYIQDGIKERQERYGANRIGWLDCGAPFLAKGESTGEVDTAVMPDLLHPNAAGHALLGECFMKYILEL